MKNKIKIFILVLAAVLIPTFTFTGCDISESASLAITKTSGTLAISTWFAFDDPGTEVKTKMTEVIDSIIECSEVMQAGQSYLDTIYPKLQLEVEAKNPQYASLILSGSIVVLTGLDELVNMNENIKNNRDTARKYVLAFCKGAKDGLTMAETSVTAKRASRAYSLRMQLKKQDK